MDYSAIDECDQHGYDVADVTSVTLACTKPAGSSQNLRLGSSLPISSYIDLSNWPIYNWHEPCLTDSEKYQNSSHATVSDGSSSDSPDVTIESSSVDLEITISSSSEQHAFINSIAEQISASETLRCFSSTSDECIHDHKLRTISGENPDWSPKLFQPQVENHDWSRQFCQSQVENPDWLRQLCQSQVENDWSHQFCQSPLENPDWSRQFCQSQVENLTAGHLRNPQMNRSSLRSLFVPIVQNCSFQSASWNCDLSPTWHTLEPSIRGRSLCKQSSQEQQDSNLEHIDVAISETSCLPYPLTERTSEEDIISPKHKPTNRSYVRRIVDLITCFIYGRTRTEEQSGDSGPNSSGGNFLEIDRKLNHSSSPKEALTRDKETKKEKRVHKTQTESNLLTFEGTRAAKNTAHSASQANDTAYSTSAAKNTAYSTSQANDTAYSTSQAKNTAYSTSQANDTAYSSQANDTTYSTSAAKNTAYSTSQANDTAYSTSAAKNTAYPTSQANDTAYSTSQATNTAYSSQANDTAYSSQATNTAYSSQANDTAYSSQANDTAYSSQANNTAYSSQAKNTAYSTSAATNTAYSTSQANDTAYSISQAKNTAYSSQAKKQTIETQTSRNNSPELNVLWNIEFGADKTTDFKRDENQSGQHPREIDAGLEEMQPSSELEEIYLEKTSRRHVLHTNKKERLFKEEMRKGDIEDSANLVCLVDDSKQGVGEKKHHSKLSNKVNKRKMLKQADLRLSRRGSSQTDNVLPEFGVGAGVGAVMGTVVGSVMGTVVGVGVWADVGAGVEAVVGTDVGEGVWAANNNNDISGELMFTKEVQTVHDGRNKFNKNRESVIVRKDKVKTANNLSLGEQGANENVKKNKENESLKEYVQPDFCLQNPGWRDVTAQIANHDRNKVSRSDLSPQKTKTTSCFKYDQETKSNLKDELRFWIRKHAQTSPSACKPITRCLGKHKMEYDGKAPPRKQARMLIEARCKLQEKFKQSEKEKNEDNTKTNTKSSQSLWKEIFEKLEKVAGYSKEPDEPKDVVKWLSLLETIVKANKLTIKNETLMKNRMRKHEGKGRDQYTLCETQMREDYREKMRRSAWEKIRDGNFNKNDFEAYGEIMSWVAENSIEDGRTTEHNDRGEIEGMKEDEKTFICGGEKCLDEKDNFQDKAVSVKTLSVFTEKEGKIVCDEKKSDNTQGSVQIRCPPCGEEKIEEAGVRKRRDFERNDDNMNGLLKNITAESETEGVVEMMRESSEGKSKITNKEVVVSNKDVEEVGISCVGTRIDQEFEKRRTGETAENCDKKQKRKIHKNSGDPKKSTEGIFLRENNINDRCTSGKVTRKHRGKLEEKYVEEKRKKIRDKYLDASEIERGNVSYQICAVSSHDARRDNKASRSDANLSQSRGKGRFKVRSLLSAEKESEEKGNTAEDSSLVRNNEKECELPGRGDRLSHGSSVTDDEKVDEKGGESAQLGQRGQEAEGDDRVHDVLEVIGEYPGKLIDAKSKDQYSITHVAKGGAALQSIGFWSSAPSFTFSNLSPVGYVKTRVLEEIERFKSRNIASPFGVPEMRELYEPPQAEPMFVSRSTLMKADEFLGLNLSSWILGAEDEVCEDSSSSLNLSMTGRVLEPSQPPPSADIFSTRNLNIEDFDEINPLESSDLAQSHKLVENNRELYFYRPPVPLPTRAKSKCRCANCTQNARGRKFQRRSRRCRRRRGSSSGKESSVSIRYQRKPAALRTLDVWAYSDLDRTTNIVANNRFYRNRFFKKELSLKNVLSLCRKSPQWREGKGTKEEESNNQNLEPCVENQVTRFHAGDCDNIQSVKCDTTIPQNCARASRTLLWSSNCSNNVTYAYKCSKCRQNLQNDDNVSPLSNTTQSAQSSRLTDKHGHGTHISQRSNFMDQHGHGTHISQRSNFMDQHGHGTHISQRSNFMEQRGHRTQSSESSNFMDQHGQGTHISQRSNFMEQRRHRTQSSESSRFSEQMVHRTDSICKIMGRNESNSSFPTTYHQSRTPMCLLSKGLDRRNSHHIPPSSRNQYSTSLAYRQALNRPLVPECFSNFSRSYAGSSSLDECIGPSRDRMRQIRSYSHLTFTPWYAKSAGHGCQGNYSTNSSFSSGFRDVMPFSSQMSCFSCKTPPGTHRQSCPIHGYL